MDEPALAARFAAVTGSAAAGALLVARYGEAHRYYHTVEHLAEVLGGVDDLAGLADDQVAVELAAWYHDAIYDPTAAAGESEARSATLAGAELPALGIGEEQLKEVHRLVRLTAGHHVNVDDRNGAVLADADLGILGADPDRYARYASGVRAEYAHLGDDTWATGRSAFLRGFFARPRLFVTDRANHRLDAVARRNLAWELASLGRREE